MNEVNANNERIGYWEIYDDGILREEGNYVNGKRDGQWAFHSPTIETRHQYFQHELETVVFTGTGNYDQE